MDRGPSPNDEIRFHEVDRGVEMDRSHDGQNLLARRDVQLDQGEPGDRRVVVRLESDVDPGETSAPVRDAGVVGPPNEDSRCEPRPFTGGVEEQWRVEGRVDARSIKLFRERPSGRVVDADGPRSIRES